ncbi:GroES-like protein [Trametes punicea]|nr:GroES-like protein [Trametes punicea]
MSAPAQTDALPPSGTMAAYRYIPGKTELQHETVPIPTPGPDEALVKILAAGVCHSDIHILKLSATNPMFSSTHTLGHEGAGIIISLGEQHAADPAAAQRLAIGTYVAICATNACLECDVCKRGLGNLCITYQKVGLGMDGCWAKYVKVPARALVPVPGNNPKDPRLLPPIVAAATDAVMTPFRALVRTANVRPEQTVLILGCGGLGQNAVQIAKHVLGARTVIASDVRSESLVLARELGADYAAAPAALLALLEERKLSVDFVFDFVGTQASMNTATEVVGIGKTIILVGLGEETVAISPWRTSLKQVTITGSFGGDNVDLEDSLEAIADGKVKPNVEERPMSECKAVLHALEKGEIRSRVALIP